MRPRLIFRSASRTSSEELATLPGKYTPPRGTLLLAFCGGAIAGCGALRSLDENVCEMKRLYVRPEFRCQGIGRIIAERLIGEAKRIGYALMRLDTIPEADARGKPALSLARLL